MNSSEFFTIGYEGRNLDEFVLYLQSFHIQRLIDVREIPISRKKGFSKSTLKNELESKNIEYIHIRSLGSPSEIRHKLKEDLDYEDFFRSYMDHLLMNSESLQEAVRYVNESVSCLMCFERTPENCHRSIVAKKILDLAGDCIQVRHI
jgi:uncharacterized protein (DUF488 family)